MPKIKKKEELEATRALLKNASDELNEIRSILTEAGLGGSVWTTPDIARMAKSRIKTLTENQERMIAEADSSSQKIGSHIKEINKLLTSINSKIETSTDSKSVTPMELCTSERVFLKPRLYSFYIAVGCKRCLEISQKGDYLEHQFRAS